MVESFTTCSSLSRDACGHADKGEAELFQNTRRLAQDYVQPCVIMQIDYTHKNHMPKYIVHITNESGRKYQSKTYDIITITRACIEGKHLFILLYFYSIITL